MKKITPFLSLTLLFPLASCGSLALTSEDKTTISSALAYIDSSSYSYPDSTRSALCRSYSRSGGSTDIHFDEWAIFDQEKGYAAHYDLNERKVLTSIYAFVYQESDGTYTSLSLPEAGVLKKTAASATSLSSAIQNIKTTQIESAANTYIAALRVFLDSSKESYFSYLDSHSVSDYVSGSKAGSFSFKMAWAKEYSDASFKGEELVSFENYLPVRSVNTGTGEWVTSTGKESLTNNYVLTFYWGEATPFYPDFTAYSVI